MPRICVRYAYGTSSKTSFSLVSKIMNFTVHDNIIVKQCI
jgi:hypothetical protein